VPTQFAACFLSFYSAFIVCDGRALYAQNELAYDGRGWNLLVWDLGHREHFYICCLLDANCNFIVSKGDFSSFGTPRSCEMNLVSGLRK
jgi:hypothetical protein